MAQTERAAESPAISRVRVGVYAKLAKAEFWDYYLSVVVVWSVVPAADRLGPRVLGLLLLVVLSQVCLFAAVVAFDDVTGYRDGSDQFNYRGASGTPRKLDRKPLLTGRLDLLSARRFAVGALVVGAALAVLAIAVAPYRPWWALALTGGVVVLSVQYSWGLKLSYRGGAEALIMFTGFCAVAAPVGFATGALGAVAVTQAALFGIWQVLVSGYSNTGDIAGDRAVGRRNVATGTTTWGNAAFLGTLALVELAAIAGLVVLGPLSWWLLPLAAPLPVLRVSQLVRAFRRNQPLVARRYGLYADRVGVLALVVANLVTYGWAN